MSKLVLIVGASSGIGKSIAELLVKDMTVVAVARRKDRLDNLRRLGVITKQFDVTDFDEIQPFVKQISKEHGKISSLIYAAGVQDISTIKSIQISKAKEMFDVNFFGAMWFAKAFSNKLIRSKSNPSIIFISSIAGDHPETGILNYSASKAALNNLTKGLAKEIAPVRVNAIAPGFLRTEMTEKFQDIYNEDFIRNMEKSLPLGLGDVEDIAQLARYLLSEESKYITGNILKLDGGGSL
jgi:3-oxoacyl-[acyl-carrier protein] reductase